MLNDFLKYCNSKGYFPENVTFTNGGPAKRFNHNKSKSLGFYYLDDLGEGRVIGSIGDWSRGNNDVDVFTNFKKSKLSKKEKRILNETLKTNREEAEKEKIKRHKEGRKYANDQWKFGTSIFTPQKLQEALKTHGYFGRKGITTGFENFNLGRIQTGQRNVIVIPIMDKDNKLMNVQFIHENGFKQFPEKAAISGGFHFMKALDNPNVNYPDKPMGPMSHHSEKIFIVEGWATGETVNNITRARTYIAFTTSNLKNVAELVRERHPGRQIVICADNDQWPKSENHKGPDNPGIHYAKEAISSVLNSFIIWPEFNKKDSRVSDQTDFNDLYVLNGRESTKGMIDDSIEAAAAMKSALMPVSLANIMNIDVEIIPLIHDLMNENDSLIIHAPGGTGKSSMSMQLALCLSCGSPFLETFEIPEPKNVLFIQSEYDIATVKFRIGKIIEHNPELKMNTDKIFFHKTGENSIMARGVFSDPPKGEEEDKLKESLEIKISELKEEHGINIDVIIIDPYVSFSDADENDSIKTRRTMDNITDLCLSLNITPILIHHDNKTGQYRGSSALHDWCRSRVHMFFNAKLDKDGILSNEKYVKELPEDALIFRHEKWNNGPLFGTIYLRRLGPSYFEKIKSYTQPNSQDDPKEEELDSQICKNVCFVFSLSFGGYIATKKNLEFEYAKFKKESWHKRHQRHINKAINLKFIQENKNKYVMVNGEKITTNKSGYILTELGKKLIKDI